MAFQHLHSFKILLSKASSCLFDDGFPDFEGKYHWTRNELNYCQTKDELFRGQILGFNVFIDPPVIKYHDLLGAQRNEEFLRETENITLNQAKIQVKDSLDRDIWQDSLVINGTFVSRHYSTSISNSFDFMQQRISAFNLEKAETLHIKRYRAGGHYSPHLDYLLVNPEPWMGNRIATFMVILKPAEAGGGTIFPNVGVNFKPRAGDAIIWLNSKPNYEVAQDSFHGACPVLSGVKVGVTIWIRSVGQELRLPCPLEENKPFDYNLLTHPKWSQRQFWTYTECSWRKGTKQCPTAKAKNVWAI
uniref:Fe2OG dioxygenase domain-containing protein n=1 Tax=Ditylenchus dipsaci TaxID=166011 RepID=A0A915EW35_9BILA